MKQHERWYYVGRRVVNSHLFFCYREQELSTGNMGRMALFTENPYPKAKIGSRLLGIYESGAFTEVLYIKLQFDATVRKNIHLWELSDEVATLQHQTKSKTDAESAANAVWILRDWVRNTPVKGLREVFGFILKQIS